LPLSLLSEDFHSPVVEALILAGVGV